MRVNIGLYKKNGINKGKMDQLLAGTFHKNSTKRGKKNKVEQQKIVKKCNMGEKITNKIVKMSKRNIPILKDMRREKLRRKKTMIKLRK